MRYEITVDFGKPYSIECRNLTDVRSKLDEIYADHILGKDVPYLDLKVLDNGKDISETQYIQEMVEHIMDDVMEE